MECAKKPLEIFQRHFNAESFDRIKQSIKIEIERSNGIDGLMYSLAKISGVQCIEYADDDDLENEDFVPGYVSEEEDSCDFLVILCYAELDNTEAKYAEVCFYIVYNDVKQEAWIDAAALSIADSPEDCAEKICYFDLESHVPIIWCGDLESYNQIDDSSDYHQ